jgi:hypothetical protein
MHYAQSKGQPAGQRVRRHSAGIHLDFRGLQEQMEPGVRPDDRRLNRMIGFRFHRVTCLEEPDAAQLLD